MNQRRELFYFHSALVLILFSTVHTKFLPVLFVLSFGFGSALQAQPESVLHLESSVRSKPPFDQGEQLEVQAYPSVAPVVMRIKVVDISHWPWVLADLEGGKTWLNFDHMIMVKTVAAAK